MFASEVEPSPLWSLLDVARTAALGAGEILRTRRGDFSAISEEGKDLKSSADLAAQESILADLASTGIPILSEELPLTEADVIGCRSRRQWIVDPLDGTVNYMRGMPTFCVSIGLWEQGQPLLGVIFIPEEGRLVEGIVGEGAWVQKRDMTGPLGDRNAIAVSDEGNPAQSIMCTGFPSGRSYETETLLEFVSGVQKYKKIRMLGSAAYMLSLVGRGCAEIYCEDNIWLWDVAAGLAIVKAAGGQIEFGPWTSQLKSRVTASNGRVVEGIGT